MAPELVRCVWMGAKECQIWNDRLDRMYLGSFTAVLDECESFYLLQTSVRGQQLREAMLCCPVPKHLRLLLYINMWDLDGSSDTINILL